MPDLLLVRIFVDECKLLRESFCVEQNIEKNVEKNIEKNYSPIGFYYCIFLIFNYILRKKIKK
jgi:hypothetical protein